jgi:hypothetical protein
VEEVLLYLQILNAFDAAMDTKTIDEKLSVYTGVVYFACVVWDAFYKFVIDGLVVFEILSERNFEITAFYCGQI